MSASRSISCLARSIQRNCPPDTIYAKISKSVRARLRKNLARPMRGFADKQSNGFRDRRFTGGIYHGLCHAACARGWIIVRVARRSTGARSHASSNRISGPHLRDRSTVRDGQQLRDSGAPGSSRRGSDPGDFVGSASKPGSGSCDIFPRKDTKHGQRKTATLGTRKQFELRSLQQLQSCHEPTDRP